MQILTYYNEAKLSFTQLNQPHLSSWMSNPIYGLFIQSHLLFKFSERCCIAAACGSSHAEHAGWYQFSCHIFVVNQNFKFHYSDGQNMDFACSQPSIIFLSAAKFF